MARAAGGTSQRLKPAFAIVLSRLRIPPLAAAVPSMLPVVFIVISPDTYGFHVNKPLQHAKLFRKNDTQKTFHPSMRIARTTGRASGFRRSTSFAMFIVIAASLPRRMSDLQRREITRSRGSFAPPVQGVRWCFGRVSSIGPDLNGS
jgi:hypothetical protein